MDKRPASKSKKPEPAKPKKQVRKSRRIFLWLFLLLLIALGGTAGSVYMGWIPLDPELVAKYKIPLHNPPEPPVTEGQAPQTNFPLVELDAEKDKRNVPPIASSPGITSVANASPAQAVNPPEKKEELERAKTLSKLGRLYGTMKPEEVVAVFNNLDDEQVLAIFSKMEDEQVGKVLAALEPRRAARLTQLMLKKK
jgi:hypothetical protein